MSGFMWVAAGAWGLMVLGFLLRRHRRFHVPLMCSVIALDVALVLYLQFDRDAVQKAMEFTLDLSKQAHIVFSTAALILYLPVAFSGYRLLRGEDSPTRRGRHRWLAYSCLILRTLGFAFMFSMAP